MDRSTPPRSIGFAPASRCARMSVGGPCGHEPGRPLAPHRRRAGRGPGPAEIRARARARAAAGAPGDGARARRTGMTADPLVPGPVYGLRTWTVAGDAGCERLAGPQRGAVWPIDGEWFAAVCPSG